MALSSSSFWDFGCLPCTCSYSVLEIQPWALCLPGKYPASLAASPALVLFLFVLKWCHIQWHNSVMLRTTPLWCGCHQYSLWSAPSGSTEAVHFLVTVARLCSQKFHGVTIFASYLSFKGHEYYWASSILCTFDTGQIWNFYCLIFYSTHLIFLHLMFLLPGLGCGGSGAGKEWLKKYFRVGVPGHWR